MTPETSHLSCSLSAPSTLHICPTCTTRKPLPLDVILPKEAWARVANSQRLGQLESVDDQLVIEDDCLMPSDPVLGEVFHTQLNDDIQDAYRIRQKWTWDLLDETDKNPPLQVAGPRGEFYSDVCEQRDLHNHCVCQGDCN
jgi:hypothetical protein